MKKTFAILLAVLLTVAVLICACTKDDTDGEESNTSDKPTVTVSESESEAADIDSDETESAAANSESESDSETEEEIPVVDLGTQKRPEITQADVGSDGTDFVFDSDQMTPDDSRLTEDSAYWESQFAGENGGRY